jgi:hypothetical protein
MVKKNSIANGRGKKKTPSRTSKEEVSELLSAKPCQKGFAGFEKRSCQALFHSSFFRHQKPFGLYGSTTEVECGTVSRCAGSVVKASQGLFPQPFLMTSNNIQRTVNNR